MNITYLNITYLKMMEIRLKESKVKNKKILKNIDKEILNLLKMNIIRTIYLFTYLI